jgi:alpha-aminoadipate/glutamate carrier protein LysW
MATCPECDAALDLEPEDVDLEDRLSCDDCGASLKVTSIAPLELELDDEDEEDDDDLDDEEDEEEDDVVEDDDAVVEEEE